MAPQILKDTIEIIPRIRKMPSRHIWFDYDKGADVLYISFVKPQQATDTEALDNGILVRKRGHKIVGLTILNASRF